MNTQQLECFVHVADNLNFTKAAEELYITTPAVTHHIKNLEEELNTTLFIRTSKMVKLTETGALFYGEARDILQRMAMAEKKVKKLASQKLAVLRIGCSSQTELSLLEESLRKLRIAFPQIYPKIIIQDYFVLRSMFDSRQVDVWIATKEMAEAANERLFKKTQSVKSYVLVHEDCPLAKQSSISFDELFSMPLITLHPRMVPFQYGNKLQEFITLFAQQHFHIICENDQAAAMLVKCGYGAAILPEFYLGKSLDHVVALPLADELVSIDYGIAYHKNVKEPYVKQFIKYFCEGENL